MSSIRVKRGTRAQLNGASISNLLLAGEVYLITDEKRLAVGLSPNSYSRFALETTAVATMTATQQSTSTALANITQLVLPVEANSIYEIDAFVTFQSAAATTGANIGILTPNGSRNMVEIVVPITSMASPTQLRVIFPNASVATNAGNVLGTGVTAIGSNHTARISGIIKTGAAAGNCQLLFATEVNASTVTLQVGSTMALKKIG